jgi:hypothetical protein
VAALLVFTGGLLAGEIQGKIKSIDTGKQTVTITTADAKDHVITVSKDTQFLTAEGQQLKEGLKDKHFKEGVNVNVKCETKQGKETCTSMQLVKAKKAG